MPELHWLQWYLNFILEVYKENCNFLGVSGKSPELPMAFFQNPKLTI